MPEADVVRPFGGQARVAKTLGTANGTLTHVSYSAMGLKRCHSCFHVVSPKGVIVGHLTLRKVLGIDMMRQLEVRVQGGDGDRRQ